MPEFTYEPRIQRATVEPLVQVIRMMEGAREIGVSRWHAADSNAGVAQILDFTVLDPFRRQGHGRKLMAATVDQVLAWHKAHGKRLRRLWGVVRQKEQVIARAFMLLSGFNHTGSVRDLLDDEDALVYVRTFD